MKKLDYTKLDAAIVAAISSGQSQFSRFACQDDVKTESCALAVQHGDPRVKPAWRFVDARVQALRKAGKIVHSNGHWIPAKKGSEA